MNCAICTGDNWENLDRLRDHRYWYDRDLRYKNPVGFKICKECGFATYDLVTDLDKTYNKQRKMIGSDHIITGNRKLRYHKKILSGFPLKPEWKYLDVGCAQGMYLAMLHQDFGVPIENLHGIEFSEICRNYAKNAYGINLASNSDEIYNGKNKFNFISYYHVFEHIQEPEKELEKMIEHLTDDGYLYLSVPTWFHTLYDSAGHTCADFEDHYNVNHLNTWSPQAYENILQRHGLEIVHTNKRVYGYSVVLKKGGKKEVVKEDYKKNIEIIEKQKEAMRLYNEQKFSEAFALYPDYPDAYIAQSLKAENYKDFEKMRAVLEFGLTQTNNDLRVWDHLAGIKLQWWEKFGENMLFEAEEMLRQSNELKPNENNEFFLGVIYGKYMGRKTEALRLFREVSNVNPTRWLECVNMMGTLLGEK